MQIPGIPPIEEFHHQSGVAYGLPWSVDPQGAEFTLTLPDGDPEEENGEWLPHRGSYEMALRVLPELGSLKERALHFLGRIVDFEKLSLDGDPYVTHVFCDARAERVTVELGWTDELSVRLGVTFFWRTRTLDQMPDWCWPIEMSFRNA